MNFRSSRSMAFYVKGYLAMVLMTWVVGQSWGLKPELEQFECKPEESCRYIFRRNALKNKPLYCYFGDDVEIKRKDVCPQENLCHKNVYHDDIDRSGKRVRAILFPNPVCGTKPVCESLSNTSFRRNDGSDVYDGYWKCQGGTRVNNVGPYTSCVPKCINGKVLERDFYVRCNESLLWEGLQTPRCVDKDQKNDNLRPPNVTVKVTSPNTLNIIVAPLDETKNVKYYRVVVTDPFSTYSRMLPWNRNLFHVHNLTCDRYHNISVVMILESGAEIPAPLQTVKTPSFIPEAPVSVNATRPNKTCVYLRWSPATNTSGIVRGYNITYQGGWKQTTGLQMEICGLRPDSDVCFFIQPYTFSTVGKATEICPPRVDVTKSSEEARGDFIIPVVITVLLVAVVGGVFVILCFCKKMKAGFWKIEIQSDTTGSRNSCDSHEMSQYTVSSDHTTCNPRTKSTNLSKTSVSSEVSDNLLGIPEEDRIPYSKETNKEQEPLLDSCTAEKGTYPGFISDNLEVVNVDSMEVNIVNNAHQTQSKVNETPNCVVNNVLTLNNNADSPDQKLTCIADVHDSRSFSSRGIPENDINRGNINHEALRGQTHALSGSKEKLNDLVPALNLRSFDTNKFADARSALYDNEELDLPPAVPMSSLSDSEDGCQMDSVLFNHNENSTNVTHDTDLITYGNYNTTKVGDSGNSFMVKYENDAGEDNKKSQDFPGVLYLSFHQEGRREKPNMAIPVQDHVDGVEIRCIVTVESFMHTCNSALDVFTKLGYKLDPDNLNPAKTWKGFAKAKLNYDDYKINATAYHTRGDKNNGHFMSLLEEMKAFGLTIGDIVEYYSKEESRREDVLHLILDNHKSCPFCDRYRKFVKRI